MIITSLVIIILLTFFIFNIFFLDRFYINEKIDSYYKSGANLNTLISQKYFEDKELYENSLGFITDSSNVYSVDLSKDESFIFIKRSEIRNGKLTFNIANNAIIDGLSIQDLVFINRKLNSNRKFNYLANIKDKSTNDSFTAIIVGVPYKEKGVALGYSIFFTNTKSISNTTYILKNQFGIIAIISLVLSSGLAFILARSFTNPILKIKKATELISKGKYDHKINIKSQDEIGLLAESINKMSEELSQIENLRKELIANISHELKTPLSLVRAYSEAIRDIDYKDEQALKEDLDIILEEVNTLNLMVEDILYLSKIQSNNSKLDVSDINILDIFKCIDHKLSYFLNEKNLTLNIQADDNIYIKGDYEKIFQSILNLVVNSINHTEDNKNIYLRASESKSKVRIEVEDEGIGIKKEELENIWDRFYKVDKSRKRNNNGTGLGMSIVKSIFEMHGFEYGIESELNKGTKIYFEYNKKRKSNQIKDQ